MNKIKRICLVLLIIILIIISILLAILWKKQNESDMSPYIMENNIQPINDDVIVPQNSYLFFGKYVEGEYSSKEIYEAIYYFAADTVKNHYTDITDFTIESIEFDEGTIKQEKEYTTAKLNVYYKNGKKISFYLKVYKKKSNQIAFYDFE